MENFPVTLAGMTVFAPGAEKAPSMPWMDRDGYRHLRDVFSQEELGARVLHLFTD